jgi:hypothetical protein
VSPARLLRITARYRSMASTLLALPQRVSRYVVLAGMAATLGATGYYSYHRAVAGDPMRLYRDEEGVWRWMSKQDQLSLKLKVGERTGGGSDLSLGPMLRSGTRGLRVPRGRVLTQPCAPGAASSPSPGAASSPSPKPLPPFSAHRCRRRMQPPSWRRTQPTHRCNSRCACGVTAWTLSGRGCAIVG